MAVWHVSGPTVYGHTGDVGDDGRLGLELGGLGRKASSHMGCKTGVSVLDALTKGRSSSQNMEGRLVIYTILVARYCERDYRVTPLWPRCSTG
jgi:hypothetical protein